MALTERFNPRARVGRDIAVLCCFVYGFVSIHAPAWGATFVLKKIADGLMCFNPRARVGRDSARARGDAENARFNPRARVGRDLKITS